MRITIFLLAAFAFSLPLNAQKDKKDDKPKHFLDTLSIGLKWRSIGPALTSGRIGDLAVHPTQKGTYYVAAASGGVWKTVNNGTTYEPIFDGQGSFSIGCVTLDPSNPNTVWVGTGENNNQRSVCYGDGIYRSQDGGKSWENMGLKNSEHIGRIIVHPTNSDIVWVAAIGPLWSEGGDRGVYKTTDGGKTWEQVLKLDEHTGVNDIILDPRNPDVLYASAFQRRRHVFTWVGGGPGSTIYKTRDGGKTWAKSANGLPSGDIGRIGLGISPANPEYLYAIVEATAGEGGFFKSTDRGASWEKQSGYTSSGNYYCEIVCHPTDPNIVYSMDTYMQFTRDGGKTFSAVGEQWKHVDNHTLWIDPQNTDHFISGCDGGLYESWDAAKTWDFKANLSVTQFYKVAVDNATPFYNIYGGTQDNFSLGGPSRTRNQNGIVNSDWFITLGGDGFESQIDPVNPNIVYTQSQHGFLARYDKSSGEALGIQPKPGPGEAAYRWNWDSPLAVSKFKPSRLYFCANKVFRTDDRGDNWTTISPDLTRQLNRNEMKVMGRVQSMDAVAKNQSTSEYGNIICFAESPLDENLLAVGTDDGLIQITENGGKSWSKIDQFPGVPENTYVNFVLASRFDKNVWYAAFNNHKRGDFKPYVFKSADRGKTWTNISNNLPERGSTYCLAEDPIDRDLLFVGTEFGCYFTPDGGKFWKKLGSGLPTICIRDMAIQERENDLVLATFGRGFYVLDDYSPLRYAKANLSEQNAKILPIKDGLIFVEATPWGMRGKAFQGASAFTAPNPPVGATFTYYLKNEYKSRKDLRKEAERKLIKDGKDVPYPTKEALEAEQKEEAAALQLEIKDASGNIIRKINTKPSKGINRITWDGRYPSKSPVRLSGGETDIFSNPDAGARATPGDYSVSLLLTVDGKTTPIAGPEKFRLEALGGLTLPAPDRAALTRTHEEANELQRRFSILQGMMGDSDNKLRHIRKAVEAMNTPSAELLDKVRELERKSKEINKIFYGDPLDGALDLPKSVSISDRLGGITYEIYSSSSMPTGTHLEQMRLAEKAMTDVAPQVKQLADVDIKALERILDEKGAPYTPGRGNR